MESWINTVWLAPIFRGYAYLDPGSGSMLLQLLVAGLLGAAFLLKTFWGRIKAFFGRVFSKDHQDTKDGQ